MEHKYKSGIGHIDDENLRIIGEEEFPKKNMKKLKKMDIGYMIVKSF